MAQPSHKSSKLGVDSVTINNAAAELLDEGKKYAHHLYEDGLKQVEKIQHDVQSYSDDVLEHVRAHPLKSLLIAGGVGLLLATLLRK